ncbi:MAG TPA: UDP-N-acetylmuramoyl-L-alanine--D-glutamate ligase [Candidatus Eisenbergiella merdipullorum]|uniref:UDP-N-acetylmuramoylalanine--D-glutamate ligase n=1 Tax=Candidatus Eisenbergiella merdipullorum TaxID=2838553 RepID=A0A9D2L2E1_9FIRM|nr:UDP-N-acetylmuramoyl-L-alanine--D-glutamate ligase [Candidatus Eisenbergiella merdipullorum]
MDVEGKKILVIGTGKSGIAAAELLLAKKAVPVLFDGNEKTDPEEVKKKLPEGADVRILVGELPEETLSDVSLAVFSPGVPVDTPFAGRIRDKGIPIWGELELGYAFLKGKVIAITGTNGKTTTTALTGQIMRDHYDSVFVVGNIGDPITAEALKTREDSVTVAEVSSFQLETTVDFHPQISAVLNVTPDHLNRHHTMENYAAVKESITKNQTREDTCVLNYSDPYTRAMGERCPVRVVWFSSKEQPPEGLYLDGEEIMRISGGKKEHVMNIHEMQLLGVHNVENVMAAIAMSLAFGVPMENILDTVRRFRAVEHRIEFVDEVNGVAYYNDSKGTNPDAAIRGIRAMTRPTILIGGGYDKQNEYDEWIEAFDGKVKKLVLIGQTREKIAACAKRHGFTDYVFADSFEECMDICVKSAGPGDAVLLSPACASWGMFPNYEVRGNMFKEYVRKLKE